MSKTREDVLNRVASLLGLAQVLGINTFDLTVDDLMLLDGPTAERADAMTKALEAIKLRLHFCGWPGESMWNIADADKPPHWMPDWRYEIDLLEHALHGSERRYPERPTDTRRRNEISTRERTGPQLRMTFKEAIAHLGQSVQRNGLLQNSVEYLSYAPGNNEAVLDGNFDADTLEAICTYMNESRES